MCTMLEPCVPFDSHVGDRWCHMGGEWHHMGVVCAVWEPCVPYGRLMEAYGRCMLHYRSSVHQMGLCDPYKSHMHHTGPCVRNLGGGWYYMADASTAWGPRGRWHCMGAVGTIWEPNVAIM